METKEELLKQYTEWTIKEVEAQKRLDSLLPNLEKEAIPTIVLTSELITQFKKAEKELNNATAKLGEILQKLWKLSK
jgi:hypothetical protein